MPETPADRLARTILVRFAEAPSERYADEVRFEGRAARVVNALRGRHPGLRVERLFTSFDANGLRRLRERFRPRNARVVMAAVDARRARAFLARAAQLAEDAFADALGDARDERAPIDLERVVRGYVERNADRIDVALLKEELGRVEFDDAFIARAMAAAPREPRVFRPPDYRAFYQLLVPSESDPRAVLGELRDLGDGLVRYAYIPGVPAVPAPQSLSLDDPMLGDQRHLRHAPEGVASACAWTLPGGDAAEVRLVDVEQGWHFDHPDLPPITLLSGLNHAEQAHGTQVMGVLAGVQGNALGVAGMAPGALLGAVSCVRAAGADGTEVTYNAYDAVLSAAACLEMGDVLLLEMQVMKTLPDGTEAWLPIEVEPGMFELLEDLHEQGIVVVAAAGNGGVDLADYVDEDGVYPLRAHPATNVIARDTRSLMVGAAARDGSRHADSNHGARVDCWAWGEDVPTTSYGVYPRGAVNLYTTAFGYTSAASAIIAGALAQLQGAHLAAQGTKLHARDLRRAIEQGPGTPAAGAGIGRMPDLCGLMYDFGLAGAIGGGAARPGTLLPVPRERYTNDNIAVASMDALEVLRRLASGELDGAQPAVAEEDGTVYVRVRNDGQQALVGVEVALFVFSAGCWPTEARWREVDRARLPELVVEPGASRLVGPLRLGERPPGEYVLASHARSAHEASFAPPTDLAELARRTRRDRGLSLRNLVVPGVDRERVEVEGVGAWALDVHLESAPDGRAFTVELEDTLPDAARVWFEVAGDGVPELERFLRVGGKQSMARTAVQPGHLFDGAPRTDERMHVRLLVAPCVDEPVTVAVRWLDEDGVPLRRVAWRLGPVPTDSPEQQQQVP